MTEEKQNITRFNNFEIIDGVPYVDGVKLATKDFRYECGDPYCGYLMVTILVKPIKQAT